MAAGPGLWGWPPLSPGTGWRDQGVTVQICTLAVNRAEASLVARASIARHRVAECPRRAVQERSSDAVRVPAGPIVVDHAPPGLRELPGRCTAGGVRAWIRSSGKPIVRELQQNPEPGVLGRTALRTLSGRVPVVGGKPALPAKGQDDPRHGRSAGTARARPVSGKHGRARPDSPGLTRIGDSVVAPMPLIRPRRGSPECPWGCVAGQGRP